MMAQGINMDPNHNAMGLTGGNLLVDELKRYIHQCDSIIFCLILEIFCFLLFFGSLFKKKEGGKEYDVLFNSIKFYFNFSNNTHLFLPIAKR